MAGKKRFLVYVMMYFQLSAGIIIVSFIDRTGTVVIAPAYDEVRTHSYTTDHL